MAGKIFVNYRRDDARDSAARLRDKLAATLGEDAVFMDVDNLLAGERFDLKLKEALAGTEVFLAVIGPRWLTLLEARMASGERDFVREEIGEALAAGIAVIPVLMDRAPMPKVASLPEDIRELALYHKHDIAYESFGRDVQALIEAIETHRHRRARAQMAAEAARLAAEKEREAREAARLAREREAARQAAEEERRTQEAARLAREREAAKAARLAKEKRQAEAGVQPHAREPENGSRWKYFAIGLAVFAAIGGGSQVYHWSRPPAPTPVSNPALTQPVGPAAPKPAFASKSAPAPVVRPPSSPPPRGEQCGGVLVDVALGGKRCIKPESGKSFKDCENCPEMVVVPAGRFTMGSPSSEAGRYSDEGPQHEVRIAKPFAVGRFAVTFTEWDTCVADGGCGGYRPKDRGWGRGSRPVIYVNWDDAKAYVKWLSDKTGKEYRLLSEAEWEYAARAGTKTPFWWGKTITTDQANYDGNYPYNGGAKGVYRKKTVPVQSFKANAWGVYQVHGNVWELVEDCWHGNYKDAPADGSAWTERCAAAYRVMRGGSWAGHARYVRAACRGLIPPGPRLNDVGFRCARVLK